MIAVSVKQDGITVDGHARYAESGNDIICAAVSAITQNLIHLLGALTDDGVVCITKFGHVDVNYENLSEYGKLLVDSFLLA